MSLVIKIAVKGTLSHIATLREENAQGFLIWMSGKRAQKVEFFKPKATGLGNRFGLVLGKGGYELRQLKVEVTAGSPVKG